MSARVPLLFQVPHAWLVALMSEWLDMPTIGMLDTAICSRKYRPQLLRSLQSMRSTSVDSFSVNRGTGFLGWKTFEWTEYWWQWLSLRRIYVERIVLRRNEVRLDLVIPSMRIASCEYFEDEDLQYLVRNCPSLHVSS